MERMVWIVRGGFGRLRVRKWKRQVGWISAMADFVGEKPSDWFWGTGVESRSTDAGEAELATHFNPWPSCATAAGTASAAPVASSPPISLAGTSDRSASAWLGCRPGRWEMLLSS